ncbi:hypothetical protein AB0D14_07790 [Streptomyces sp. NPDC048484]|uniref:hypothetical protein n=1 Tax=Streptomyces sp. NPDC048484 TaxID=3155146 RepID=UPI003432E715
MRTARLRACVTSPAGSAPVLWAGWAALAAGAVLCVLGWYGISGERYAERQLPYLASCTVPGAALIIAGAILLTHGRNALAGARVEELYGLLVAAGPADADGTVAGQAAAAPVAVSGDLLMVPGGTLWHRSDCPLVTGKPQALPVDSRVLAGGDLDPCPICEPTASAGSPDDPSDRPSDDPSSGPSPGASSGPSPGTAG